MTKANTLLFFLLIIVPITCFAQEKSILNYKEIAMGKSADGNNIMFPVQVNIRVNKITAV